MKTLALAPDQDGYVVEWAETAVGVKLEGGAMRLRRAVLNAPVKISVTWTCDSQEFEYLKTFYRVTNEGTEPFIMSLIVASPELTQHVCRFVPKTFKTSGVRGKNLFKVQAQLEVETLYGDDAFDEGLVTSFEAFGTEAHEAYALLATLANVDMPESLK